MVWPSALCPAVHGIPLTQKEEIPKLAKNRREMDKVKLS